MRARLRNLYHTEIISDLMRLLELKNVMQIPKLLKITLNMGVGEAVNDKKNIELACKDLEAISGQKPIITYAKKSIATFKVREGWPIGCKVTLRGDKMYEFLDRLISVAIPRIRDFRGFTSKSLDGMGNYNIGIRENVVFPEINYEKIDGMKGMDIAITTSAKTNDHALALLKAFNFPIKK